MRRQWASATLAARTIVGCRISGKRCRLVRLTQAAAADTAAMAPPRIALIGCGFFAANHLHAWRELRDEGLVEIAAVADRDPARARAAADAFAVPAWHDDAERLLAEVRPDAVDIVTTAPSHAALIGLAARRRIAVICQKPLAPTFAEARAAAAACAAAGTQLTVHENFRWQRPLRALIDRLDRGDLGRPFFIRISLRSRFDVYRAQPYLATDRRFIIADLGVHLLDLARRCGGEVQRLACHTARVNPAIAGEDCATMHLVTAGGASCVVDCSYAAWRDPDPFPHCAVEVDCERGSLRVDERCLLTATTAAGTVRSEAAPAPRPWFAPPFAVVQDSVLAFQRDWLACRAAGRQPETIAADNLATMALVEAAYRAAETGATLTLQATTGAQA